ncbi:carbohydrate sulfotransferase 1-like [Liolophura sinensis]|uniref:carbohydrate sulfotransferase 1-like n=1 Tax=Liolophura sinensis TaxID=3198878 RepID=UPI0031587528
MDLDSKNSPLLCTTCQIPYFAVCRQRRMVMVVIMTLIFVLFISWTMKADVRSHAYKAYGGDIAQNATSFEVTAEVRNKIRGPVKVLVLAYFRSGSTLTGELIQQTKGTFYVFEPFHQMEYHYLKTGEPPTLINGTKWPNTLEGLQMPYQVHTLESLFNCQIKRIDKRALTPFAEQSVMVSNYSKCRKSMEECAEELGSACLGSPIREIKTIRTPMRFVTELLKKDPSVKVIHLLRDPRGLINSWITYGYKPKTDILPQYVCNLIGDDLKTRYELEKQYPGTFLSLIYEDLAQHPMEMLHKIYGWLGMLVDTKVIDWLNRSTHSDKDGKFLDTYKQKFHGGSIFLDKEDFSGTVKLD